MLSSPDDERLVEVPEIVHGDGPAQPVRGHELPQLLQDVLHQLLVPLPSSLVEPHRKPSMKEDF